MDVRTPGDTYYPISDPANYLIGRWELSRWVIDRTAEVEGNFTGTGTFTCGDGGLYYVEQGVLRLGDHRGPAGRVLHYRPDGPCRLVVEFTDGRFFHDLDLRTGRWRMRHLCRYDDYRGEITALSPSHWRQIWQVTGPTKHQSLENDYIRMGP